MSGVGWQWWERCVSGVRWHGQRGGNVKRGASIRGGRLLKNPLKKGAFNRSIPVINDYLSKLCMERNIYLIDHSKTFKTQHLNGSKLHLNRRGPPILQNTLCNFLSKIFH